jgi:response regulator RpfG family c-di-GMP phosphodiesterase
VFDDILGGVQSRTEFFLLHQKRAGFSDPFLDQEPEKGTLESRFEISPALKVLKERGKMKESTVLIVDDAKEVLSALKRELKDVPFQLLLAGSSEEALKLLEKKSCKVIISDVKMSKMDGFELLEKVHSKYPDMIRMVLSGHSDVKLILDIVNKKGIDRYLTKPWNIDTLKLSIESGLKLYDLKKK